MNTKDIKNLVDTLGSLKAQIANLAAKEKTVKDLLIANGNGTYEGDFFRVTVSTSERATLDVAAAKTKLAPQFIAAHTTVVEVTAVRVVARNNVAIAA